MDCKSVYDCLRSIDREEFPLVDWASVSYLTDKGLLENMTTATYDARLRGAREIKGLEAERSELSTEVQTLSRQIQTTEKKHGSWFYRAITSKQKLNSEKGALKFTEPKYKNLSKGVTDLSSRISELRLQRQQTAAFKNVGGIYAHITAQGVHYMNIIEKYLDKGLDAWDYERFAATQEKGATKSLEELLGAS